MMTDKSIIDFWGERNLIRWDAVEIRWVGVPVDTHAFLKEVGLPSVSDWSFKFGPSGLFVSPAPDDSGAWIIGHEYDDLVFLDSNHEWEVRHRSYKCVNRFVNSTVRCFAECLLEFRRFQLDSQDTNNISADMKRISAAEAAMRAIDECAIVTENSFWCLVLDDLRSM